MTAPVLKEIIPGWGDVAEVVPERLDRDLLARAMAYGTALASFNVEAFGTERLQTLASPEIAGRVLELAALTRFVAAAVPLRD